MTNNFTVKQVIDVIKKYFENVEIEFVESKIMNQLSYEVFSKKILDTGFEYKGSLNKSIEETHKLLMK